MHKNRGGFPEGQSPIVLDTLSNVEYNIKYKKNQTNKTVYNILQEHVNEETLTCPTRATVRNVVTQGQTVLAHVGVAKFRGRWPRPLDCHVTVP